MDEIVKMTRYVRLCRYDEPANERLFKTMKRTTAEARANGLTPDMTDELLKDDE